MDQTTEEMENRPAKARLSGISRATASAAPPPDKPAPRPVAPVPTRGEKPPSTFLRVSRYVAVRAVTLLLMVSIGVFLAILVINYGGYIDRIFQAQIDESLMNLGLSMRGATPEELVQATEQARWQMEEAMGLHEPFLSRCVRWWWHAMRFDWGQTYLRVTTYASSVRRDVGDVLLDALPNTLLLAGTANVLLFFTSIALALRLSKGHGSFADRLLVGLSPISTIPNWVYGIVLTVIFAGALRLLPFGGMFDDLPPPTPIGYVPIVLKHMILPVAAIFLSLFFQGVYSWRTFFLIHSGEDYVELARAQGLPSKTIDRRYLLRPALPYILTSFALMLLTFWQGVLVLEAFFNWPGIGLLFLQAVRTNSREVTVAAIVAFAYLLAISVFVLDIVYALVDPRVRVTGGERRLRAAGRRRLGWRLPFGRPRSTPRPAPTIRPAVAPPADPHRDPPRTNSNSSTTVRAASVSKRLAGLWLHVRAGGAFLRELARYPSAVFGLLVIGALVVVAVTTVFAIPYPTAVQHWRAGDPGRYHVPANGLPEWVNYFRKEKLPPTIALNSQDGTAQKVAVPGADGTQTITLTYTIEYPYGEVPQDVKVYFDAQYQAKRPFVTLAWLTADGRTLDLGRFSIVTGQTFVASEQVPAGAAAGNSSDKGWLRGRGGAPTQQVLFYDPATEPPALIKGTYTLRIVAYTFEPDSTVDAEVVLLGQVYGPAGTDDMRRDLMVGLLWGTTIALALGLVGAVLTALLSMAIAAVGTWYGGWVDSLVQRITEITMILPALPIALMIYYAYSKSVWVILGAIVLLSIFGSSVKSYRAIFLQAKEAPYIEAARAYGASSWRMIRRYLVPRILPLLIPQLVFLIPTYVFFEATLTYLNVSDPNMPTWGKIIYDALTRGAFEGKTYWVLEPTVLIILTGLAFALLGFALDRILNPRLRSL